MTLSVIEELDKVEKRIKKPERILAKELFQPFSNINSASRKTMLASHLEQAHDLVNPEVPLIQTGYEDEYGRYSSSYITSDENYDVVGVIPKYDTYPKHHYLVLLKQTNGNKYHLVERISYHHITETFGYLINNDKLDSLYLGSKIKKDEVIQHSNGYTKYGNKMNGVNLLTLYSSIHETTEDGIVISESASKKLSAPLIHNVQIIINDNDIPLNLYGNNEHYKSFPDIGEYIKDNLLCAIRREKKQESLYTLSWDRLRDILMSDDKYPVNGRVVDIDIACNNPEGLETSFYNPQLYKYYCKSLAYSKKIVDTLGPIVNNDKFECSYDLSKTYQFHTMILKGCKWIKDKPFSNVVLNIVVQEVIPAREGDKITDRYGGKGVITKVIPDEEMPQIADTGERVELLINNIGPVGRLNPGQLMELSVNFITSKITKSWNMNDMYNDSLSKYLDDYFTLLKVVSDKHYEYSYNMINKLSPADKEIFVKSLSNDIFLSLEPISESVDIDKLDLLYKTFPWIEPYDVLMSIRDSNNNLRQIKARRTLVVGKKYIYRLKQNSKNKFSATSLSATNIKNEPAKSKSSKLYKAPYSKTPVRFGEMETGNMLHFINVYPVVSNLMLHSTSPIGRREAIHLLTGNPFDVNIELTDEAKNRNVEILNAYLKTIGLEIIFTKTLIVRESPISFNVLSFRDTEGKTSPIRFLGKGFTLSPITIDESPISFDVIKFTK